MIYKLNIMRKLVYLLLAMPLAFAACSDAPIEEPSTPDVPETPAPTPNEDENEFSYCGGEYYGDYYSTLAGNYYVHLSDVGFDEDGSYLPNGRYFTLDIYAPFYEGEEGANVPLPIGTYNLDANGTMAQWTIDARYSVYVVTDADAEESEVSFEELQLVVTEEGVVLTATVGQENYTITFKGQPTIADKRIVGSESVTFEASKAWAYYYGDYYNPGVADNFYFFISDLGLDEEGYELPNGTYYRFDVYASMIDPSEGIKLPYGMYAIDPSDSLQPGSIANSASLYYIMDEYAVDVVDGGYYNSGYINVDETGVTGEFLINGVKHTVSFEGEIEYFDVSDEVGGEEPGDEDIYSTLSSDYVCNFDDHTLYYAYYGDYYEVGFYNWTFAIIPNDFEGDTVQFDIIASEDSYKEFFGEYTIDSNYGRFTALPGKIEDGYMSYSWYYTDDGLTMAPFTSGWMNVTPADGDSVSVAFNVMDDKGNTVSGSWTGPMLSAESLMATRSSVVFQGK